jgi:hypothetical protein
MLAQILPLTTTSTTTPLLNSSFLISEVNSFNFVSITVAFISEDSLTE